MVVIKHIMWNQSFYLGVILIICPGEYLVTWIMYLCVLTVLLVLTSKSGPFFLTRGYCFLSSIDLSLKSSSYSSNNS
jgi:hypothetical protein